MRITVKLVIFGLLIAAPATAFAQRGGGTRPRGDSRDAARGSASRDVSRSGLRIVTPYAPYSPYAYVPIPVYSPYLDPIVSSGPWSIGPAFTTYIPSPFGTNIQSPVPVPLSVAAPSVQAPAADKVQSLTSQVQELTAEVQRLRSDQVKQNVIVPETRRALPSTSLVFTDRHTIEIQSYAIVGQTLKVLDSDNSARIALADLDLDATRKVNQDKGIRFVVPSAQ